MPRLTAGLFGLAMIFAALEAPAAAATAESFSCRASAARVELPAPLGTFEPVRANAPRTPCSTGSVSVVYPTALGPLSADAVGAFTARQGTGPGSAFASASHAAVVLPGLDVKATAVEATATSTCAGATPANAGTSRVAGVVINGSAITLPPGDAPLDIPLGPLGSVSLNKEIVEGTTLTRRAVEVKTPVATVVLAEAIVGHGAGACQPDAAGSGTNTNTNTNINTNTNTGGDAGGTAGNNSSGGNGAQGPRVCPDGATYDPSRNLCVIRDGNDVIVVGPPYSGPSGGTVMTLADARKLSKSACLRGAGPKYAIVGSKRADLITGTNRRDRILLLAGNDKAEGGRGDDCIDGGRGGDTMSGALGKDRLIGASGKDHLVGGSHSDRLSSGSGADTISSGFGKDKIDAGKGNDRINASTAGPASKRIKCGKGQDKIRVNRNERRKARRGACEIVYTIR